MGSDAQQFTTVGVACTANVCESTQIEHSDKSGTKSISGVQTGETVSFICDDGYEKQTVTEKGETLLPFITCQVNGFMSTVLCEPTEATRKKNEKPKTKKDGAATSDGTRGGGTTDNTENNNADEVLSPSSDAEEREGSRWSSHWVVIVGMVCVFGALCGVAGIIIYVVHYRNTHQQHQQLDGQRNTRKEVQVQPMSKLKASGWGGRRMTKADHDDAYGSDSMSSDEELYLDEPPQQKNSFNRTHSQIGASLRLHTLTSNRTVL